MGRGEVAADVHRRCTLLGLRQHPRVQRRALVRRAEGHHVARGQLAHPDGGFLFGVVIEKVSQSTYGSVLDSNSGRPIDSWGS